jgi:hypothetical protein
MSVFLFQQTLFNLCKNQKNPQFLEGFAFS